MDRHAWIDEQLAAVPLFADLSKKELREVSSLATRLEFPAGKELTRQGEFGNEFIIVLEGEVEVRIDDEVIATRGPGEYFGEIALLDDVPRTATVVATTPVSAEVIGRREFASLMKDVPDLEKQISAVAEQRIAEDDQLKQ